MPCMLAHMPTPRQVGVGAGVSGVYHVGTVCGDVVVVDFVVGDIEA